MFLSIYGFFNFVCIEKSAHQTKCEPTTTTTSATREQQRKKNNWIIAVTGNRKTSTTQTTKWNENKEERISNRISFFSLPRLLEHSARTMWICSMRKIAKVLRNSTNLLNTSMKSLCCARCFVGCFFLSLSRRRRHRCCCCCILFRCEFVLFSLFHIHNIRHTFQ